MTSYQVRIIETAAYILKVEASNEDEAIHLAGQNFTGADDISDFFSHVVDRTTEVTGITPERVSVWKLADDSDYGAQAGWFILTSPDGEVEMDGGPWETEAEAEAYATGQGWLVVQPTAEA